MKTLFLLKMNGNLMTMELQENKTETLDEF